MEKVCKEHREKPAIMYGQCIGCELDSGDYTECNNDASAERK